jgi:putative ABC transport system substrate-binding protein
MGVPGPPAEREGPLFDRAALRDGESVRDQKKRSTVRHAFGRLLTMAAFQLLLTPAALAEELRAAVASLVPGPPACPQTSPVRTAFEAAIRRAGFGDASFTRFCYAELSDIPARIQQMLGAKPTVVVVWGSAPAVRVVLTSTGTLPVIFSDAADPVGNGLVRSLSRPGGTVTGISSVDEDLVNKRVELLKEALPNLSRLAVLGNLSNPDQSRYAERTLQAARSIGVEARVYSVESRQQLLLAFHAIARDGMDAMVLLPDAWFYPMRSEITELAAAHRIPAMYTNTAYPDVGGLLTYAPDLVAMGEQVGGFVAKLLKGGRTNDMPVEQPTKFELVVNAKTARLLGIHLSPATMLRATRVVE